MSGLFGWTSTRTFRYLSAPLFGRWLPFQPSGNEHTYPAVVATLAPPSLSSSADANGLGRAAELICRVLVSAPLVHARYSALSGLFERTFGRTVRTLFVP